MCLCVCMYGLCMHVSKGACGDQRSMLDVFLLLSALSFVTEYLPQPPSGSTGWLAHPGICLSLRSIALGCGHALACPNLTFMLEMQAQVLMIAQQACYSLSYLVSHVCLCVHLSSFPPSTGALSSLCCPGWHKACDPPVLVSRHAPPHDLWHLWQALVLSENRLPSSRGLIPLVHVRCVHMRGELACAWKPTVLLYPSHSLFSACV